MSIRKNERILNLLFALMSTRSFLSKENIREIIEDYQDLKDDAFERQFERDKDSLRSLGVPIEVGSYDPWHPGEGYRINRAEVELPEIEIEPEEGAIIALASKVWQGTSMGSAVTTSLAKLHSIGIEVDSESIPLLAPGIAIADESFEVFVESIQLRRAVTFSYIDAQGKASQRQIQPWGLLNWRDRWYVGGFDIDRNEPRLFRLSRVSDKPKFIGKSESYEIPADADLKKIATLMFGEGGDQVAHLEVAHGRGQALRQKAQKAHTGAEFDSLHISFSNVEDFASELCSYGPHVRVIQPEDLRTAVIEKLRRIAEAS